MRRRYHKTRASHLSATLNHSPSKHHMTAIRPKTLADTYFPALAEAGVQGRGIIKVCFTFHRRDSFFATWIARLEDFLTSTVLFHRTMDHLPCCSAKEQTYADLFEGDTPFLLDISRENSLSPYHPIVSARQPRRTSIFLIVVSRFRTFRRRLCLGSGIPFLLIREYFVKRSCERFLSQVDYDLYDIYSRQLSG